jgi:lipoate-protein ligase A
VMLEGRKVGGAAQRRTRHGLLHQGSICLGLVPEECLRDILAVDASVLEQMRLHSCPLLGAQPSVAEIREARVYLKHLLLSSISDIV